MKSLRVFAIAVFLATLYTFTIQRSHAYVEAPMSFGAIVAQSTNIVLMRVELAEIQHFRWRRRFAGATLIASLRRLLRLHAFVPDWCILLGQASGRHDGVAFFEEESAEQCLEFRQAVDRRRQGRQRGLADAVDAAGPQQTDGP